MEIKNALVTITANYHAQPFAVRSGRTHHVNKRALSNSLGDHARRALQRFLFRHRWTQGANFGGRDPQRFVVPFASHRLLPVS